MDISRKYKRGKYFQDTEILLHITYKSYHKTLEDSNKINIKVIEGSVIR